MLVVVTVQTQQFPVAAIARIVVVIVIFVMYRKLLQAFAREFTGTAAANPRVYFQRLLAIARFACLTIVDGLGNHVVKTGR